MQPSVRARSGDRLGCGAEASLQLDGSLLRRQQTLPGQRHSFRVCPNPSLTRPLMLNGFCPNRRASCGAHIDLNQFAFSPGLFRCMVKGDSSD